ncbi:MAG TPA: methanol dehydrogenase [Candidatus Marinimicrobia bacterium]|nr:methanol dehydrogenase [Candidatus Neomarinimicrobiota bacterium]
MLRLLWILLISVVWLPAQQLMIPEYSANVVDEANILNIDTRLNQYLQDFYRETGIQIAVLTIRDLGDESIESFSLRVAEAWQVGSSQGDKGILLVIAYNNKKMRIEVGYGLEEKLTDYRSGFILRNLTQPLFAENQYDQGVVRTISAIIETVGPRAGASHSRNDPGSSSPLAPLVMIITIIFFLKLSRRNPGMLILGSILMNQKGGRGFGGGSFGGFSGGGGGRFGGGGASGSW